MRRRRLVIGAVLALALAAIAVGTARRLAARRLRDDLALAREDMAAGRIALAHGRLSDLGRWWPGQPEVEYRLGESELARGRPGEALAAWARVPSGSAIAAKAAERRATLLINIGRYSPAEAVLEHALRRPASAAEREAQRRAMNRLLRFEGRIDDLRRLLLASWPEVPDPAGVLKEMWLLDNSPVPVESWGRALRAADPEDDRVWLGLANEAILTGRFAEAARLLDKGLRRRPDDPAIWRARLALAEATDDVPGAWDAMAHLPASALSEPQSLSLGAWLAARRGDRTAEYRWLKRLVESDTGNAGGIERLAILAREEGHRDEARVLGERKAEIDRARSRYRMLLLDGNNLTGRADEFARLAETLGRDFDSRAWALLARGRAGGEAAHSLARMASSSGSATRAGGGTLADRLADARPPEDQVAATSSAMPRLLAVKGEDEVKAVPPVFADDAEAAGLRFLFDNGQSPLRQLPETMSGGVGVLDFDGDGWLDVYCIQGGPLSPPDPTQAGEGDRLFRNKRDGTFEDVTERSGLAAFARGYGHGVTVGDVDNDGHTDLFVTRLVSYALYRNQGDGTFRDITEAAGLAGSRDNPTSAAFADLDNDGDLDLYVCHYMLYDPENPRLCKSDKGDYFYCDPSRVEPATDHLFRNDGGRFVDVTAEAGIVDADGRGLGVVAIDVDGDDKIDLYVANDGTANFLFRNLGGFRFEEVGHAAGAAASGDGGYQASMGVACGDVDGDGRPDLLVTNFYGEASTLYQNLGGGLFSDRTAESGLGIATRYLLGFGTAFLDFDNDGRLDLITANGHVNDNRPFYPYSMPAQLLRGGAGGRFDDVSSGAGPPWSVPRVGRGLASADLDNDGRVDALILPQNDPLAYFHNRTAGGHFVTFRLEGAKSNRDAVGARVTLVSGGLTRTAWRFGGGSYQSASDPRLHFGLGDATRIDSVEVHWPASGQTDRFEGLPAGAGYLLREGGGSPSRIPAFPPLAEPLPAK